MAKKADILSQFGIVPASQLKPDKYIRTGFSRIDDARSEPGIYGLKCGATTIIYGETGAGKSTLTYQILANAMADNDDMWLICDVENSFRAEWAAALGCDLERLMVMPIGEFIETTFEGVRQVIASGQFRGVVVDSIHAQATQREAKEGRSLEEENPLGALPGKISQFIKATKSTLVTTGTVMILIGQARANISGYGDPIHLTGGYNLQHDADLTIQMLRTTAGTACEGIIPRGEDGRFKGHMARIKVEKCRGRGMGKRFVMPFIEGEGFSEARCLVEECMVADWGQSILAVSGSWIRWIDAAGAEQKFQGKAAVLDYFMASKSELARLQAAAIKAQSGKVEIDEPSETVPPSSGGEDDRRPRKR